MERLPSAVKELGSCNLYPQVIVLVYPIQSGQLVRPDLCVHEIAGMVHKEIIHGLVIGVVVRCFSSSLLM